MKYEMNWWGGEKGNHLPIRHDEGTPKFSLMGERMEEPEFMLFATVEAENKEAAWEQIRKYWPEAQEQSCEEHGGQTND